MLKRKTINNKVEEIEEMFKNMNKKIKQNKYTNLMPSMERISINSSLDNLNIRPKSVEREKKKSAKYIDNKNTNQNSRPKSAKPMKNSLSDVDLNIKLPNNINNKQSSNGKNIKNEIMNDFPLSSPDNKDIYQYLREQTTQIAMLEDQLKIEKSNEEEMKSKQITIINDLKIKHEKIINDLKLGYEEFITNLKLDYDYQISKLNQEIDELLEQNKSIKTLTKENKELSKQNVTIKNQLNIQKKDQVKINEKNKINEIEIINLQKENEELKKGMKGVIGFQARKAMANAALKSNLQKQPLTTISSNQNSNHNSNANSRRNSKMTEKSLSINEKENNSTSVNSDKQNKSDKFINKLADVEIIQEDELNLSIEDENTGCLSMFINDVEQPNSTKDNNSCLNMMGF